MNTTAATTSWSLRLLSWLLALAVLAYIALFSTRILGLLCLVGAYLVGGIWFRQHRRRCFCIGCTLFLVLQLSPIDITFHHAPGGPHFVPYVSGMPSRSGIEAHKRGEIHLTYSCIRYSNEPKYVLVW